MPFNMILQFLRWRFDDCGSMTVDSIYLLGLLGLVWENRQENVRLPFQYGENHYTSSADIMGMLIHIEITQLSKLHHLQHYTVSRSDPGSLWSFNITSGREHARGFRNGWVSLDTMLENDYFQVRSVTGHGDLTRDLAMLAMFIE